MKLSDDMKSEVNIIVQSRCCRYLYSIYVKNNYQIITFIFKDERILVKKERKYIQYKYDLMIKGLL